jgi:hypothetical protein
MASVFSFCIYGAKPIYCEGMVRNLETIAIHYPTFETHIFAGNDVPEEYLRRYESFPLTTIHLLPFTGGRLTFNRFLAIDLPGVQLMIVRDADSRLTDRDRWCLDDFIASAWQIYCVRDHKYHTREVMAGLWGMRRIPGFTMGKAYSEFAPVCHDIDAYQADQDFLRNVVYRKFKAVTLAYSPNWAFPGENHRLISLARKDAYDFCGNVILVEKGVETPKFVADDSQPDGFRHLVRLHKYSRDGYTLRFIDRLWATLAGD